MPTTLHNEAAIAGIGQTAYTKNSGVSELHLATECVRKAIDDAGIEPSEVDGLVTYTMDSSDEVEVARTVGIGDMTFWSQVNYGGGAAVGLVAHAAMAIFGSLLAARTDDEVAPAWFLKILLTGVGGLNEIKVIAARTAD